MRTTPATTSLFAATHLNPFRGDWKELTFPTRITSTFRGRRADPFPLFTTNSLELHSFSPGRFLPNMGTRRQGFSTLVSGRVTVPSFTAHFSSDSWGQNSLRRGRCQKNELLPSLCRHDNLCSASSASLISISGHPPCRAMVTWHLKLTFHLKIATRIYGYSVSEERVISIC